MATQANDSQELELVVASPASAKARDGQDLTLSIALPNSARVRLNQDLILLVLGKGRYPITFVVT